MLPCRTRQEHRLIYDSEDDLVDMINQVLEWVESFTQTPWFYMVILVIALVDSVFPAVPSETTVILGGIAAGQGELAVSLVIVMAIIGASAGDSLAYFLGDKLGRRVTRWIMRGENSSERLDRAANQIAKRGGMLLVTGRFVPGGRTAVTVSCGLTHQPYGWFVRWDLLAVTVWGVYGGLLGYYFGERFKDNHSAAFWWAFGTAMSVAGLYEVFRWVRARRSTAETGEQQT